jgi:hypothetical protein
VRLECCSGRQIFDPAVPQRTISAAEVEYRIAKAVRNCR